MSTVIGAGALHQALFTAVDSGDEDTFNTLLQQNYATIRMEFDVWRVVPENIRTNQQLALRYINSLFLVARAIAVAGDRWFLNQLVGQPENNPIVGWERKLSNAQALSEGGAYAESNAALDEVLAQMAGASGSAVDSLRPKILGSRAFNALHQQEYQAAVDFTSQAFAASVAAHDDNGRAVYYENLQSLQVILALHSEPERGELALRVRRTVTRAQDAADAGCYSACVDLLGEALRVATDSDDALVQVMLPKIHGLAGFCAFKQGDMSGAQEQTSHALDLSRMLGDADGTRIYSANLETIVAAS